MSHQLARIGLEVGHETSDATWDFARDGTISWLHGMRFMPGRAQPATIASMCRRFRRNMGWHPAQFRAPGKLWGARTGPPGTRAGARSAPGSSRASGDAPRGGRARPRSTCPSSSSGTRCARWSRWRRNSVPPTTTSRALSNRPTSTFSRPPPRCGPNAPTGTRRAASTRSGGTSRCTRATCSRRKTPASSPTRGQGRGDTPVRGGVARAGLLLTNARARGRCETVMRRREGVNGGVDGRGRARRRRRRRRVRTPRVENGTFDQARRRLRESSGRSSPTSRRAAGTGTTTRSRETRPGARRRRFARVRRRVGP